jgi:hypothetical protein
LASKFIDAGRTLFTAGGTYSGDELLLIRLTVMNGNEQIYYICSIL